MIVLTQQQSQQIAGGNVMDVTSEMPEFRPITLEKFYTIIIKTLCDYQPGTFDLSVQ
jgi:hypothetical protein